MDEEHGLNWYDYSARYYDPIVPRFTSIDPMAEKYYSISPYAYVANNPMKYIDPDGRKFKIYYQDDEDKEAVHEFNPNTEYTGDNSFVQSIYDAYNYLKENKVDMQVFDTFIGNDNVSIDVKETITDNRFNGNKKYETYDSDFPNREGEQSVGTVHWDNSVGLEYKDESGKKGKFPGSVILLHEVGHGYNIVKEGAGTTAFRIGHREKGWTNAEERINITNNEHPATEALGLPLRANHGGKTYKTSGVNSTLTPKEFKKLNKNK